MDILFTGTTKVVHQLQCVSWPDMEAPKETKTMLDIFSLSEELLLENPGTLLVHCSAGVGRTGTFIGLFKLIKDFQNKVCRKQVLLLNSNQFYAAS